VRLSDERRVVTVLFGDVVGFTPYSEAHDPEQVKNLLDRCFERLAADVTSHGGRVDKIVGDELMAVFGAPVAHEDDPERAVRAAIQMQKTLEEHATETGSEVRMRIGINTGEVLVGALRGGTDVTALGDVVNTAKRLQTSAEAGQVLVGPATESSTRGVIAYEPVGALALKGRGAPVDGWVAVEALGPPGFRPGRARTRLFGRKAELGMLWHALGTMTAHARPHLVLLVGDAGVGKTRLVEEAIDVAQSQHNALVLEGRCLPYGEANPWWPVAEALRQACDIDEDDPAEVAARKCREAIATLLGAADEGVEASRVADGLLYVMGHEGTLHDIEPSRALEEAVRAVQVSLAANARQRPLVIALSEIHWADQLILDLIDTMFERLRALPILLLATARPELYERWTPKPGRHDLHVLNLNPLDLEASTELVRALLEGEPTSELVDVIVERGGGNPLFLEELVAILGETDSGPGHDGAPAELPATLRGLVSARLDTLERRDRSLLEDAAVIGRSGPLEALDALAAARGETAGASLLTVLGDKDLLVVGDGSYEFKSDLVRDVAYETLTKGERARRHAAVAQWLADYSQRTEREQEHLERIAHHFAQAAQLVAEVGAVDGVSADIMDTAVSWIDRAATRAESRETTAVSVHLLDHALALIGSAHPAQRAKFLLGRARGRATLRDMEGSHADIAEALEIGEKTGDDAVCAQALTVRGDVEQRQGDLESSAATLEKAVGIWKEVGDRRGEAEALRLWGFTSLHRGELDAAEAAISDALDISRMLGDRRGEAWALQNLAWVPFTRGDNDLAEQRLLAATNLFDEIGDFGGRSWAQGLLGYVWYFKGRLADAGVVAEGGIEITRESGDRWAHGMMLNLLAAVRLWQGRTKEALDRSLQGLRLFEDMGDDLGYQFASVGAAMGRVLTGRRDEALAMIEDYFLRSGSIFGGFGGVMTAAAIHSLLGQGEEALAVIEQGIGETDDSDVLTARALAKLVAGRFTDAYDDATAAWATNPTETGARANYASMLALTAAAAGQPHEAVSAGDEVGGVGGTYLDQIRAHLGRAFGYAQLGDDTKARTALDSARRISEPSEDDLHRALVRLATSVVGAVRGWDDAAPVVDAVEALGRLGVAGDAWERVFRAAASGPDQSSGLFA
jgi:class 3 adenylate cyclase/tetratricopeptide (TPR) repeat protein